jgi:hypothetical protein
MPVVDTTTPFSNNEQITSTKLNNIMDNSFFVSGAVVPSRGLEVTAGGQLQVPNSGITTALIADANIIPAKLSNSDFGDFTVSGGVATIDNGVVTPAKLSQPFTSGTAVTASGSSIDFTSIPSWAKKITIIINEVSTTVNSPILIRIGTSSGIETTGYSTTISNIASTAGTASYTIGFYASTTLVSSRNLTGIASICLVGSNTWISSYVGNDGSNSIISSGSKILSSTLDRISLVATAGSFDAGSVNIIYQ